MTKRGVISGDAQNWTDAWFLVVGKLVHNHVETVRMWPVALRFDRAAAEEYRAACEQQAAEYYARISLGTTIETLHGFRAVMLDPWFQPISREPVQYTVWTLHEDPRASTPADDFGMPEFTHELAGPEVVMCPHRGHGMAGPEGGWIPALGRLEPVEACDTECRLPLDHEGSHQPPCGANCDRTCAHIQRRCERVECDTPLPLGWGAVYCSTACALADA